MAEQASKATPRGRGRTIRYLERENDENQKHKNVQEKINAEVKVSDSLGEGDHSEAGKLDLATPFRPTPKPRTKFSEETVMTESPPLHTCSPNPFMTLSPLHKKVPEKTSAAVGFSRKLGAMFPKLNPPVVKSQETQTLTPTISTQHTQTATQTTSGQHTQTPTRTTSFQETQISPTEFDDETPRNCTECELRKELKEIKELLSKLGASLNKVEGKSEK